MSSLTKQFSSTFDPNNDDHPIVKITLHDLCPIGSFNDLAGYSNVIPEFYNKMRNVKRKIAFSLNFDHVASISVPDVIEVRISHNCNCIVTLSTDSGYKFYCLDLNTHKQVAIFGAIGKPSYFHVEENYDGNHNDALIYGTSDGVLKFDLKQLIRNNESNTNYIWKQSGLTSSRGIVSSHACNEANIIYVCNTETNNVVALSSKTGEILYTLDDDESNAELENMHSIEITDTNNTLFVSQYRKGILKLYRSSLVPCIWKKGLLYGGDDIKTPDGLVFDTVSRHLLVCDYGKNGIVVLTENGQVVKLFSEEEKEEEAGKTKFDPTGLCLDAQTGFLYVADSSNNRIRIFK